MMIQSVQRKPSRSHIALLLSTLLILLSGGVTLAWQIAQGQSSRADGGNIVGPPTLPAETVDKIFASVGSPMAGTGKVVEQAARAANIDDAFALAVWWVETNDGQAGVGLNNRNPGAVQGTNGYIFYPSYAAAAADWFTVLRSRYVNRGLTSVYTICYPYVGTSTSLEWANKVVNNMLRYRGEAPPPTPTPTLGHAPIALQFEAAHNPEADTSRQARTEQQPTAATQTQTPVMTGNALPQNSLLLVIGGLMVALLLAVAGLGVRRRTATVMEVEKVTEALEPGIELPPLYVNEFSPIAEPLSSPAFPWWEQSQQAQPIKEPISSADGLFATTSARGNIFSFAAEPVLVIDGVPQLSFDEQPVFTGSAGGPQSIGGVPQLSFDEPIAIRQPQYRPGLSLPGLVPDNGSAQPQLESVSAGPARTGGGLLRRYAMEQAGGR
ncbi:hypothetical protein KSF_035430 [Reticulibacter mediterranei]|uniref:Mannosyl-glycoprotein endo-beta-N-acetylglucosamidase-like domain-containing protein n=1 Tax=Reticulibacter mediterranei TaxID=2778369 RepID=A0A8J3IMQ6_9CHLR|nr:hypothetical protein [Reticulibacter mediterranei]GHO93495.1 hypothetical protein KSF_035430 [Reticulibacter mediterranei]